MFNLYIDTSIPSACFDLSKPKRLKFTENWLKNINKKYHLFISELTLSEIDNLITIEKKKNIKNLIKLYYFKILKITPKAQNISKKYIKNGAFPPTEPEDALHIAIAAINKIKNIASWDFKHIVSENPIKKVNEINLKLNLPILNIGTPEIF